MKLKPFSNNFRGTYFSNRYFKSFINFTVIPLLIFDTIFIQLQKSKYMSRKRRNQILTTVIVNATIKAQITVSILGTRGCLLK